MFNLGEIVPSRRAKEFAKKNGIDLLLILSYYSNEVWPDMTEAEQIELRENVWHKRNIWARHKAAGGMFIFDTNFETNKTRVRMLEEI